MLILALSVASLLLINYFIVKKLLRFIRIYKQTYNWPSPPCLPLVGHAHHFFGLSQEEIVYMIRDIWDKYGRNDRFKMWFGTELNLFTANLDDLAIIFNSKDYLEKGKQYETVSRWLGEGLLTSSGAKWFQRRKLITPAFHFSKLKQIVHILEDKSPNLIQNLEAYAVKRIPCHFFSVITQHTLDVICESINANTAPSKEYVKAIEEMRIIHQTRMSSLWHHFEFIYRFTSLARCEKKCVKILHNFSNEIVKKKRKEVDTSTWREKKESFLRADENGQKGRLSFLDILFMSEADGKPLNDNEIREEIDTFIFEGTDTTAGAINFLFYNICRNPTYQEKCYEEIIEVFGQEKALTYELLSDLPFIEACIKESLRMFPSVGIMSRITKKDCHLNDITVPAGTNVVICPLYMGRCKHFFEDPNTYKPERFLRDSMDEKTAKTFAYVPFSAGPRNCIGQKYALLEIKAVVVKILQKFKVQLIGDHSNDIDLRIGLITVSRDPLMFQFSPRVKS